ncbi:hypothetical protein BofuT4_uP021990.1 [Botrytis cinerea T4]|uniref:Uncharacterized protein n=1 Tax=Botryotinia fuckeliana (strain T4) TaxID=999810 RepID=G2YGP7_BOTF4|nr:hypothetical protein BofuT4_uP021990.1 [Botrytis cinerea T4]
MAGGTTTTFSIPRQPAHQRSRITLTVLNHQFRICNKR